MIFDFNCILHDHDSKVVPGCPGSQSMQMSTLSSSLLSHPHQCATHSETEPCQKGFWVFPQQLYFVTQVLSRIKHALPKASSSHLDSTDSPPIRCHTHLVPVELFLLLAMTTTAGSSWSQQLCPSTRALCSASADADTGELTVANGLWAQDSLQCKSLHYLSQLLHMFRISKTLPTMHYTC